MSAIDQPRTAPKEILMDADGYILPGQLSALASPPPAPPEAMTPTEPVQPPAAPREIRLDEAGYIVQPTAVEKPAPPSVPSAGEVWTLVQNYRDFGQFSARQNIQKALVARDEETARLRERLARWEAAVGATLETVEEVEAGGGTAAATTPTPAGG
jgi:hypothetical protein